MAQVQDRGFFKKLFKESSKKQTVNKDNKETLEQPKSKPTNEIFYDTSNPIIGFALIFNQTKIKTFKRRKGSELDAERIKSSLLLYGFKVAQFDDLKKQEIFNILLKYSKMDHSKHDCLVVIVLSHGKPGKVYAADESYWVDDLWMPFLGENCPTLVNKPKLFFIQACRGIKTDAGVLHQSRQRCASRRFQKFDMMEQEDEELITYHIPHTADLLVHYSTFENHVAWRSTEIGSCFIQNLAKVFEEYAQYNEGKELYFLLTLVNRNVAYNYQSDNSKKELNLKKQMPCIVSTLTKIFLVTPKIIK